MGKLDCELQERCALELLDCSQAISYAPSNPKNDNETRGRIGNLNCPKLNQKSRDDNFVQFLCFFKKRFPLWYLT